MTPNFSKLRQSLRTGGWTGHATNLPNYVATHGIGCTRELGERTLRFVVQPDEDGNPKARAYLLERGGHRLVADETHLYLRREALARPKGAAPTVNTTVNLTPGLAARLRRLVKSSGLSQSDVLRRALDLYLKGRGF